MSTYLEQRVVQWPIARRGRRAARQSLVLLANLFIILALAASLVYFATASQTVRLLVGLAQEALREQPAKPAPAASEESPVVVSLRASARGGTLLPP